MQTGNQKLNTLAYVWMNGHICITLAEVSVFLLAHNVRFGLSTFFRWIL